MLEWLKAIRGEGQDRESSLQNSTKALKNLAFFYGIIYNVI